MSLTLNESSTPPPEDNISNIIAKKATSAGNESATGFNPVNPYSNELEFVIKQQFASSLQQNRAERIKYAKYTFVLTCIWIFLVLACIFCSSFKHHGEKILEISDQVLILLISTTTLNVFGFFLLVMQFLFNKEELATLSFLISNKNDTSKPEKKEQESSG